MQARCLTLWGGLFALLGASWAHADDMPLRVAAVPRTTLSTLREPEADEVVVVINANATLGNHAGLFAGKLLLDPAGSYVGMRGADQDWEGPTLADYAQFQMVDGLNIRFYRFRLPAPAFSAIVQRIRESGITPPFFCASAVQNLLAGVPPFDAVKGINWTSPSALGGVLDALTQGEQAAGECHTLTQPSC
jgi:hypothetical protein